MSSTSVYSSICGGQSSPAIEKERPNMALSAVTQSVPPTDSSQAEAPAPKVRAAALHWNQERNEALLAAIKSQPSIYELVKTLKAHSLFKGITVNSQKVRSQLEILGREMGKHGVTLPVIERSYRADGKELAGFYSNLP